VSIEICLKRGKNVQQAFIVLTKEILKNFKELERFLELFFGILFPFQKIFH